VKLLNEREMKKSLRGRESRSLLDRLGSWKRFQLLELKVLILLKQEGMAYSKKCQLLN